MALRHFLIPIVLLTALPAAAAPIADPEAWAKEFTTVALANDPDAMLAKVNEIAHPGFQLDALRGIFAKLDAIVGTRPGDYAEQFDEKNIGTFMKRINVAIHYQNSFLFYSITFGRDPRGWQMTQFDYNTDVNKVFSLAWPE